MQSISKPETIAESILCSSEVEAKPMRAVGGSEKQRGRLARFFGGVSQVMKEIFTTEPYYRNETARTTPYDYIHVRGIF